MAKDTSLTFQGNKHTRKLKKNRGVNENPHKKEPKVLHGMEKAIRAIKSAKAQTSPFKTKLQENEYDHFQFEEIAFAQSFTGCGGKIFACKERNKQTNTPLLTPRIVN
ncbi:unnamed protein product, partial [Dovyalis caffra]